MKSDRKIENICRDVSVQDWDKKKLFLIRAQKYRYLKFENDSQWTKLDHNKQKIELKISLT